MTDKPQPPTTFFVALITALRKDETGVKVDARAMTIVARRKEQAEQIASDAVITHYPSLDGWYNHRCNIRSIPMQPIMDIANQYINYSYILSPDRKTAASGFSTGGL